jgi:deoxyribonuclease-4
MSNTDVFKVGCHLSSSNGYLAMGKTALEIGANTFQFFTRNPRGGAAKPISQKDVDAYLKLAEENDIGPIVAHAPYTLNACAADERIREFAFEVMSDDLKRLEYTPNSYYNFHPGSHVQQGVEKGIELICDLLNRILSPEQSTLVLLETMAGKGSEIGRSFEELRTIIDNVELSQQLGVCLDTCHIWDGGYDIVSDLDGVIAEFDNVIGLNRLKAIHLNGSLNTLAAHKDRHAKLGEGQLPIDAIARVINHPKLRDLPFLLETPNELDGYAKEIALLKDLRK